MAVRMLPLSVAELCVHALELAREAASRLHEYSDRMRLLGAEPLAAVFEAFEKDKRIQGHALEGACQGRRLPELSPWEYAWRIAYAPGKLDPSPRILPLDAREALELALAAERRAAAFYDDVAEHARDVAVRACAADLATHSRPQVQRLEHLLAEEVRAALTLRSRRDRLKIRSQQETNARSSEA